jgi:hypothetical protein
VYNRPNPIAAGHRHKGPDTGRRRAPCVAITLAVIDTGADFSTNKNTKTVEP